MMPAGIEIGFLDEEERAGLPGFQRTLDRALAADDDDLGRRVDGLHPRSSSMPSVSGSSKSSSTTAGRHEAEQLLATRAVAGGAHLVARRARRLLDDHLQPLGHHRLVVDDEHTVPLASSRVVGIHASSATSAGSTGTERTKRVVFDSNTQFSRERSSACTLTVAQSAIRLARTPEGPAPGGDRRRRPSGPAPRTRPRRGAGQTGRRP